MTIFYKTSPWSTAIVRVEVTGFTSKTVSFPNGRRMKRVSSLGVFHSSYDDARSMMVRIALNNLNGAEITLAKRQAELAVVRMIPLSDPEAMEPEETQQEQ